VSEPNTKKTLFLFALCVVVGLMGCGGGAPEGETTATGGTSSGILIFVMGDVGAGDEAALAAQETFGGGGSVIFERHYTASTDTQGALRSILSGYPVTALDAGESEDGQRPTLSELFARMDYYTFGVVGGDPSLLGSGTERGFDEYRFDATASNDELISAVVEAIGRAQGDYLGLVSLANADRAAVEGLATALQGIGAFENTLFVVTADHGSDEGVGDSFDERLRESVTHVPLVVRFPGGERPETLAPRTTSLTSGLDILPSLVALAGRDISGALPGSNILDGFFSGHALVESGDAWAFLQDNYKLIFSGEKALVFDLAADPSEQNDLASEMTDRSRALLTGAIQTRTDMISGVPGELDGEEGVDPETLEHLRSLGYVQ
jgi:arylsulfatase A-like enzyme